MSSATTDKKYVTMGWDLEPTISLEGGYVLPRKAELIINAKYYPNYPEEKWPRDPVTGEKLEIAPEKPIAPPDKTQIREILSWLWPF